MTFQRSYSVARVCPYCSTENHIHVATENSLDAQAVRCSVCGKEIGTVAELRKEGQMKLQPESTA